MIYSDIYIPITRATSPINGRATEHELGLALLLEQAQLNLITIHAGLSFALH